jgi:hypothetical protein
MPFVRARYRLPKPVQQLLPPPSTNPSSLSTESEEYRYGLVAGRAATIPVSTVRTVPSSR